MDLSVSSGLQPLYWSGFACARTRHRFYCPLLWSTTQLVEGFLTSCSPSHSACWGRGRMCRCCFCRTGLWEHILSLSSSILQYNPFTCVNTGQQIWACLQEQCHTKSRFMSHSLRRTSSPTVGRDQSECKEGGVCSADLISHHTCETESGQKGPAFLSKLERLSSIQ